MSSAKEGRPDGADRSSTPEGGDAPGQPATSEPSGANETAADVTAPKPRKSRRRLWKSIGITAGVLLALALIITFVPNLAIRHLIERELSALGISTDGVKTINLNLWQREFSLGPVRIGAPEAEPAVIQELHGEFRLYRLLYQQAVITSLIIEGVNIDVVLDEESDLLLNGISLGQFIAPEQREAREPEPEDEGEPGWGAGLDLFELRNSTLSFEDVSKGDVTLNVNRLTLREFRTWEPDNPGTFEFIGEVNGIPIQASGEARPFGDQQVINVDAKVTDIRFDPIAQYTGPLGLQRNEGTFNLEATSNIIAGPEDRLEVGTNLLINMMDVDYLLPDRGAAAFSGGTIDVLVNYVRTAESGDDASGTVDLDLTDGTFVAPQASLGFSSLAFASGEFSVRRPPDGPLTAKAKPTLAVTQPRVEQPVVLTADNLRADIPSLGAEVAGSATSIQMNVRTVLENATVKTGDDQQGSAEVALSRLAIELPSVAANTNASGQSFKATATAAVENLVATVAQVMAADDRAAQTFRVGVGSLALDVPSVDGSASADTMTVDLSAGLGVKELTIAGGAASSAGAESLEKPIDVSIGQIDVGLGNTQIRKTGAELAASGAATASIEVVNANLARAEQRPATAASIASAEAEVVSFDATVAEDAMSWSGAFSATVAAIEAALDGGESADARLGSVVLSNATIDQGLAFMAHSLILNDVDIGFTDRMFAGKPEEAAEEVAEEAEQIAPPTIALGRFAIENGGKVRFADGSTSPPTKMDLDIATLAATNINTGDPASRSELAFDGKLNEFTSLKLVGWAMLFAEPRTFDVTSKADNVQLVTFSPYAAKAIGMNLESGSLDADVKADANSGDLSGLIDLEMSGLQFSALSPADAEAISAKVGLPIETAVGLLQDPQGNIDLKLPISGTVANPEVDYSEAISKAVSGALASIFPPTAIANLLISAADSSGGLSFKALPFAPGSAELTPEAKEQADNLAELLTDRPKLKIKVCGRATSADFEHYLAQPAAATMGGGTPATTPPPDADQAAAADAPPDAQAAANPPADAQTPADNAATAGTAPSAASAPPAPLPQDTEAFRQKYRADLTDLAVERGRAVRRYIVEQTGGNSSAVEECRSAFDPLDNEVPRVRVTL